MTGKTFSIFVGSIFLTALFFVLAFATNISMGFCWCLELLWCAANGYFTYTYCNQDQTEELLIDSCFFCFFISIVCVITITLFWL